MIFIIDTAATICAVSKLDLFDSVYKTNKTVMWGNAQRLSINLAGDIIFRTNTNLIYRLTNVLYVPQLGINILSTHILKKSVSLFNREKATIFDQYRNIMLIGHKKDNLYRTTLYMMHKKPHKVDSGQLKSENQSDEIYQDQSIQSTSSSDTTTKLRLWHNRLGHIGLIPLQRLLSQANISLSNTEIRDYMQDICEICIQSKYNKKINKSSTSAAEFGIGERIHSDIGGPISPKTYNGYRYYITFLDKASRYLYISLLRSKDEAIKKFVLYKQLVKN